MNRLQLSILWMVGVAISLILFTVGVGSPYLVNSRYDERIRTLSKPALEITKEGSRKDLDDAAKLRALNVANEMMKMANEIDAQRDQDSATRYHLILGGAFPLLIIGVCAFLTAGRGGLASLSTPR